jgi:hypothetical protein
VSDNKYKVFRNFMVNELGITREDIKEWAMQAVKETVDKELRGINISSLVYDLARKAVDGNYGYGNLQKEAISNALHKAIDEKIEFTFRLKERADDSQKN